MCKWFRRFFPVKIKRSDRVIKIDKGTNLQLSNDFSSREFDCHCNNCSDTYIDMKHINNLQRLRDILGRRIYINSGFRCRSHNIAVGGASKSRHMFGDACDISVKGLNPIDVHKVAEFFTGLGLYRTFIHIDSRPGKKARW